jgi:hypothetical protein
MTAPRRNEMATAVCTTTEPAAVNARGKSKDARRRKRLELSLPVEVRPFDARFIDIVDVGEVVDFTRDGLYFSTCMPHYFMGMRLIVTFPFGKNVSAHRKFLGTVVRMEDRTSGSRGIAVKFVL